MPDLGRFGFEIEEKIHYVVHLEDQPEDRKALEQLFPRIARSLERFFDETFRYEDPEDKKLSFGPNTIFELRSFNSVEEMAKGLMDAPRSPSLVARSAVLFVFDYYVPQSEEEEPRELLANAVDGLPFDQWLGSVFPQVPTVLLTVGRVAEIQRGIPADWKYVMKDQLRNPSAFVRSLSQHYVDWWEPTFARRLENYAASVGAQSWHTPGHNSGNAFLRSRFQRCFYESLGPMSFQTDLSVSVDSLGDLSEPEGDPPLSRSMRRSAAIFGSEETYFITNGTSTSNKALLMSLLKPGELVLLDRNCHKSVHQAVVMSGALPIYLSPAFNECLGIWTPLSRSALESLITAPYPDLLRPRMLILTTCTYEGLIYPIDEISSLCEAYGMLFYADEAWAPYLRFHPYYRREGSPYRYNGTDAGAHFTVQSTHKALAAFSQASMIHVGKHFRSLLEENRDPEWQWLRQRFHFAGEGSYSSFRHNLLEVLRYWHSTSPHYPMLASLDRAGVQMRLEGMDVLADRLAWVEDFERTATGGNFLIEKEHIVGPVKRDEYDGYLKDPLKLVIGLKSKACGIEFKRALSEAHIQWEKSARGCVEFLVTIGTFPAHIEHLLKVVLEHNDLLGRPSPTELSRPGAFQEKCSGQVAVLPRDAAVSSGDLVPLSQSSGAICAQMVVPYPPGIPVLLPGMTIEPAAVELVKSAEQEGSWHDVHGIHLHEEQPHIKVLSSSEAKGLRSGKKGDSAPVAETMRTLEELEIIDTRQDES